MNSPKVIKEIVHNDLCIGCGLCAYVCPEKALQIVWDDYGFLVPENNGNCKSNGICTDVCPFNIYPKKEVKTENELANIFLQDNQLHHSKVGKYIGIYAGYANNFRLSSSSGGMATYISSQLIKRGIVDHIFSVKQSNNKSNSYTYVISSTSEEVVKSAKTRYYPVSLIEVFEKLNQIEGKVAIVGVACFIKSIRLAQERDSYLKEKIPFLIGIICGGVKSRFFTEYLVSKTGTSLSDYRYPEFRIKDYNSTANDYSFGCIDNKTNTKKTIKMLSVGNMWGPGLFKANACDYCDDVTTELADISLGDAWITPYNLDGKGSNVIVTRTSNAEKIVKEGIQRDEISIEPITLEKFLSSQKGSYNHRHTGLLYRIQQANKKNKLVPPKRFDNEIISRYFKYVQLLRSKTREKSLQIWQNTKDSDIFDKNIKLYLGLLKFATKIYHIKRNLNNRLKYNLWKTTTQKRK